MSEKLVPYRYKWVGMVMVISGSLFAVLSNRFNLRIEAPVFSIISTFIETRLFVFSRTNITDEIILLLVIPGFLLVIFSREKKESEHLTIVRLQSLRKAVLWNSIFLILGVIFLYGSSFMALVMVNLFSVFLFYLIFFHIGKKNLKR